MKKKTLKILFLLVLLFGIGFFFLRDGTITGYTVWGKSPSLVDNGCPNCNVILIIVDTLRADHVGAYGYERDTTPNIDKLAREGILFKNVIAQSSWTMPTVPSILTGLYPKNHGFWEVGHVLAEDNLLLSEILKEKGYGTYAFIANPTVSLQGFDQGYDLFINLNKTGDFPYADADQVNEKLIPFIEGLKRKEKNFIHIHYMEPHHPYMGKGKHFSLSNKNEFDEDFFRNYQIQGEFKDKTISEEEKLTNELINLYDDDILYNDELIGDVIQTLKDKDMYENSIIIVVSDHGEEFFEHASNLHGRNLYDEVLRVPWIMRVPKVRPLTVEKQVGQIDMLPTILSLLSIPTPDNIDGMNVLSSEKRDFVYSELDHRFTSLFSIRSLDEKLIIGTELFKGLPIFWFKDQIAFKFESNKNAKVSLFSFFKNQKIKVIIDGYVIREENITIEGRYLKIPAMSNTTEDQLKEVHIVSSSPCKKVSDLGKVDDSRCLNIGTLNKLADWEERRLLPIYKYFLFKSDPAEQQNLYPELEFQERVEYLESKLFNYIKDGNEKTTSKELAQYTDEQLEALKALGYI